MPTLGMGIDFEQSYSWWFVITAMSPTTSRSKSVDTEGYINVLQIVISLLWQQLFSNVNVQV